MQEESQDVNTLLGKGFLARTSQAVTGAAMLTISAPVIRLTLLKATRLEFGRNLSVPSLQEVKNSRQVPS